MQRSLNKRWQGFAPQHLPMPGKLCAVYHCPNQRYEGRRYCKEHALQYDREALEQETKILEFPCPT